MNNFYDELPFFLLVVLPIVLIGGARYWREILRWFIDIGADYRRIAGWMGGR